MEKIDNIDAEIVKAQSVLFDVEHDLKLLSRKKKRTKRTMYITGEGERLGDPYVAIGIIEDQLAELKMRKAEAEERLESLLNEKQKAEEGRQNNV